MAKILSFKDIGVDCDFIVRGHTEDEVLERALKRGRTECLMDKFSSNVKRMIKSAVKEE